MLRQRGTTHGCCQHLERKATAVSYSKPIWPRHSPSSLTYSTDTSSDLRGSFTARSSSSARTVDTFSTTNEKPTLQPNSSSQPAHTDALVVGGGPAGLATALMLARRGYSVTVAERQAQVSYSDPDRSYVYAIDGRGRQFTDSYGLSHKLAEQGVDTLAVNVTRVHPDGKVQNSRQVIKDEKRVVHWLPRTNFIRILEDAALQEPNSSFIRLLTNTEAAEVKRTAPSSSSSSSSSSSGGSSTQEVEVLLHNTVNGNTQTFKPKLLVACDGIGSIVRTSLQKWAAEGSGSSSSSSNGSGRFHMSESPSLSTDLRFKVLQLPPNPQMNDGTVLNNPDFCILIGKKSQMIGGSPLRLGLLPIKDISVGRTANLIALPNHPVWGVTDADGMYSVFEQAFPQADWRKLVPEPVMAKFASSKGGQFPAPQYSTGLSMVLSMDTPAAASSSSSSSGGSVSAAVKGCGVVVLGDAAHCFPPDLGQGVNSALEDVCVLEQQLAAAGDDLAAALPAYEQQRLPDSAALAKLVQIGFPLQYNQYPILRFFWNIRFISQVLAHKLLPFLISPPLFIMIQDPNQSYSRILAATERSRKLVLLLGVALAAAVAWLIPQLVRGVAAAIAAAT